MATGTQHRHSHNWADAQNGSFEVSRTFDIGRLRKDSGLRFGILTVKSHLAEFGSLLRVRSWSQIGLLDEVTPTCISVFLVLTAF